eukprot:SAG31_NODE_9956_length_1206_cov_0.802168_1_plen_156_part_00
MMRLTQLASYKKNTFNPPHRAPMYHVSRYVCPTVASATQQYQMARHLEGIHAGQGMRAVRCKYLRTALVELQTPPCVVPYKNLRQHKTEKLRLRTDQCSRISHRKTTRHRGPQQPHGTPLCPVIAEVRHQRIDVCSLRAAMYQNFEQVVGSLNQM